MRKLSVLIASLALLQTPPAHALFIDFESVPGLTATPTPAQGGALNNNSELNDEIVPLRITSGGLTSDPADAFPSISGLLDLTGTAFGPAHSGTNVVAGTEGGSGGVGLQANIDFRNFVEIRFLDAGYTSVSVWIELFGTGTTANVKVCGDLNCGDELTPPLSSVSASGLFSFTAPAGKEIRNVSMIPIAGVDGGMWIDDVTVTQSTTPGTADEPATLLLLGASIAALLGLRRSRQAP